MLQKCLDQLQFSRNTVFADKDYGSSKKREYIANRDANYCIPPTSNTAELWYCDYEHYKKQHVVEGFLMRIKDCRRIAMHVEKWLVGFQISFIWQLHRSGLHNCTCNGCLETHPKTNVKFIHFRCSTIKSIVSEIFYTMI